MRWPLSSSAAGALLLMSGCFLFCAGLLRTMYCPWRAMMNCWAASLRLTFGYLPVVESYRPGYSCQVTFNTEGPVWTLRTPEVRSWLYANSPGERTSSFCVRVSLIFVQFPLLQERLMIACIKIIPRQSRLFTTYATHDANEDNRQRLPGRI